MAQWVNNAGPRRAKGALALLASIRREQHMHEEHDDDGTKRVYYIMFGCTRSDVGEKLDVLHAKYGGELTVSNLAAATADFSALLADLQATRPVVNRQPVAV